MTEPDRPRRDVSIEEAERMPMTDEELYEIVQRRCDYTSTNDDIDALVAEVRRLRAKFLALADELDAEGEQTNFPYAEEPAYYHGLSEAATRIRVDVGQP